MEGGHMKTRILIDITGGVVQSVVSNQDIELYLVDWDEPQEDDVDDVSQCLRMREADTVLTDDKFLHNLYEVSHAINTQLENKNHEENQH